MNIQLLSMEEIRKPLWEQYYRLKKALGETEKLLRATGVDSFPDQGEANVLVENSLAASEFIVVEPKGNQIQPKYSLTQIVKEACKALKTNITLENVGGYIRREYPNFEFNSNSASAILSSGLVKSGLIKIDPTAEKSGRGNVYVLTELGDIL